MPATNLSKNIAKRMNPYDKQHKAIVQCIWGGMSASGITNEQMSECIGIAPKTLYSRKQNPEKFSIEELRILSKKLEVPMIQLLSFIA